MLREMMICGLNLIIAMAMCNVATAATCGGKNVLNIDADHSQPVDKRGSALPKRDRET